MPSSPIADIARAVESQGVPFLTWDDWFPGGRPDKIRGSYPGWTKLHPQRFPASGHWVHHSVTKSTTTPEQAARTVNNIGIGRFGKMSYPFLIHPAGVVLQGCYPYIGAHTKNHNSTTLAGCNIGNYEIEQPPTALLDANVALIRALRVTGHYPYGVITVLGHQQSQYAATSCPGRHLMDALPYISRNANLPMPGPGPTPPTQPPTPPAPLPLESDVFFLKADNDAKVWLIEPGRMTHITDVDNLNALADALDIPVQPAVVDSRQFLLIAEGRKQHV